MAGGPQRGGEPVAELGGVPLQRAVPEQVEDGKRNRAGERVAAECAAVLARLEEPEHLVRADDR